MSLIIKQTQILSVLHVPVYRAFVKYEDYLGDLDPVILKQRIKAANERVKGFPGLVIGSLEEVKNTGNWE